jgi:hypothetical protein
MGRDFKQHMSGARAEKPPLQLLQVSATKKVYKEMGSRYLFICLYVWLEKYFSRGDYRRAPD